MSKRTELAVDLAERLDQIEDHPEGPAWPEARRAAKVQFLRYHLGLPDDLADDDADALVWLGDQDESAIVGVVHLALLGRHP